MRLRAVADDSAGIATSPLPSALFEELMPLDTTHEIAGTAVN
jgi:hypothetical protein